MKKTSGHLREWMSNGASLSGHTQAYMNAIAWKLNSRTRKIHGSRTDLHVFNNMLEMTQMSDSVLH